MKTPEEYFAQQDFSSVEAASGQFTDAERAFIDKYMGGNAEQVLNSIDLPAPQAQAQESGAVAAPAAPQQNREAFTGTLLDAPAPVKSLYDDMRTSPELLMVGFYLGTQEFIIPTAVVQEVIRAMPIAKLPAAPAIVSGVINLRGKVTPLVKLRDLLEVASPRQSNDDFFIICKHDGLQVGLVIERIHTMYRVPQTEIDWDIEAQLGANGDTIAGLAKINGKLVSIIFVDKIVETILN